MIWPLVEKLDACPIDESDSEGTRAVMLETMGDQVQAIVEEFSAALRPESSNNLMINTAAPTGTQAKNRLQNLSPSLQTKAWPQALARQASKMKPTKRFLNFQAERLWTARADRQIIFQRMHQTLGIPRRHPSPQIANDDSYLKAEKNQGEKCIFLNGRTVMFGCYSGLFKGLEPAPKELNPEVTELPLPLLFLGRPLCYASTLPWGHRPFLGDLPPPDPIPIQVLIHWKC
ncbi:hypothetical protein SLEP1_g59538 [Rubroshorea leprosula]|uniref:Uncharacterized protein n=1 Tax=Rubroshorea leprosula TaxID=152421 RepID=A0AAV5MVV4_9ROSI|nr:hypothetical protein SLEP1_g59538 [Rubroshorea leprosula]